MTNHRGATRHDILPGGRYPGQDLYDVLLARCERAEAEVERLRAALADIRVQLDLSLADPESVRSIVDKALDSAKAS
jgi:hypothetical protein